MDNHLHSASTSNFNGSRISHILLSFNLNGGRGKGIRGQSPQRLVILGDLLSK